MISDTVGRPYSNGSGGACVSPLIDRLIVFFDDSAMIDPAAIPIVCIQKRGQVRLSAGVARRCR